MSETKKCPKCSKTKPVTEFWKDKHRPDGLNPYCRDCRGPYSRRKLREYRNTEQGKLNVRNSLLQCKFGITLAEYDAMFEAQDGVCAICGKPETRKYGETVTRLCVDHNHATGKVRSLLCTKCNAMVGFADEDTDILLKTSEYLRRHAA